MLEISTKDFEVYEKVKVQLEKNALEQYLLEVQQASDILKACGISECAFRYLPPEKTKEVVHMVLSDEECFERYYNAVKRSLSSFDEDHLHENRFDLMEIFKAIYGTFLKDHEDLLEDFTFETDYIKRDGNVYKLTDEEMERIYNHKKREKEIDEVEDFLNLSYNYDYFVELLPYPSECMFVKMTHNQDFLKAIYDKFSKYLRQEISYDDAMNRSIEESVHEFSDCCKTDDVIEYERYLEKCMKERGYSVGQLQYMQKHKTDDTLLSYEDYFSQFLY